MEISSLNSFTALTRVSTKGLLENPFMFSKTINVTPNKRFGIPRKLKILACRAQASGITKAGSEVLETVSRDANLKDRNLVFVAGATGKVGSRTVRELLKLGFNVRAGVRNKSRADSLVQIARQMKLKDASSGGNQAIEKLDIVECDLEKRDQIRPALGKASIVICCIGASEKEIFDVTGPYRIDYMATKNLIDAATIEKVNHFILLTSLGTNKIGFPAAILNLFWGVLCWKRKSEEALIASGLPYSIVRPGGMERPTDSYKLTHNITLSEEDTLFGGQVSNLQVAELLACMAKNRGISYCKVLEVVAETTAPLTPMDDLLKKISSKRIEIVPSSDADTIPSKRIEIVPANDEDKIPSERTEIVPSSDADEPSPFVPESGTSEPSTPSVVEEASPARPALTRPLSPYTAYEDLKPPTTPSPTPPSKTGDLKANLETLLPVSDSPPSAVESSSSGASNIAIESGSLQKKGNHSLSPYPNYPDLKPPVSPTPNKPGVPKAISTPEAAPTAAADSSESNKLVEIAGESSEPESLSEQQPIARPLSPYAMYEDLKPPSSPSPNAPVIEENGGVVPGQAPSVTQQTKPGVPKAISTPEAAPTAAADSSESNKLVEIAGESSEPESLAEQQPIARPLSPYAMYEDLKPPSSPSPNAPVIEENGGVAPGQAPSVTQHESLSNQYTLSPFTMYEDLKPPSSPSPSFRGV